MLSAAKSSLSSTLTLGSLPHVSFKIQLHLGTRTFPSCRGGSLTPCRGGGWSAGCCLTPGTGCDDQCRCMYVWLICIIHFGEKWKWSLYFLPSSFYILILWLIAFDTKLFWKTSPQWRILTASVSCFFAILAGVGYRDNQLNIAYLGNQPNISCPEISLKCQPQESQQDNLIPRVWIFLPCGFEI